MFNFDEEDDRLITSTKHKEDTAENCLRPKSMDEYIGQDKICMDLQDLEKQLFLILLQTR